MASASLGRGLAVKSVDSLKAFGNLYILGGGKSGIGKSIYANPILKPLYDFQGQLIRARKQSAWQIPSKLREVQEKIRKIENGEAPGSEDSSDRNAELLELKSQEATLLEPPTLPRTITDDVTVERLAILAGENNGVIANISPDARGAIKNLNGRYGAGGTTNEDIFLKGFSVEPILQDRVTRASVDTVGCFTIVWLTQMDNLRGLYNKDTLTECGLLCRFLPFSFSYRRPPNSFEEVEPPKEQAEQFYSRIKELLETYHQKQDEHYSISASPGARAVLCNFRKQILDQIDDGSLEWILPFAHRLGEQAWRVALVFHALENGRWSHERKVSEQNARAAVRVVRWFFGQTKMLFGGAVQSKEDTKLSVARDFVVKSKSGVTPRDLQRYKQGLFSDSTDARDTLEELVMEGSIQKGDPGRTQRYYARPAVKS